MHRFRCIVTDMDALDLIRLGRQLTKVGEEAMRGSGAHPLPTGPTLVMSDVLSHPDSSITEITGRTGLPQSYVSASVARLREEGIVATAADPSDGRRTLVRMSDRHMGNVARRGAIAVDAALAAALHEDGPDAITETLATLGDLAVRLRPAQPGPFLQQLRAVRAEHGAPTAGAGRPAG